MEGAAGEADRLPPDQGVYWGLAKDTEGSPRVAAKKLFNRECFSHACMLERLLQPQPQADLGET